MARVRGNADVGSREARRRLKGRREPYFFTIERGLALGYRKSAEGGAWVMRRYDSSLGRHFEQRIATADDHSDPDGAEVLSFAQAQRDVLKRSHVTAERTSGASYTVADAVGDYLDYLRAHRKSADDAKIKFNAYVIPHLAEKRLADLKPRDFEEWVDWAMKRQARRKPKKLKAPPKRPRKTKSADAPAKEVRKVEAAEQKRRRKATVNRVIGMLKACLNYAHGRKKVATTDAWVGLKKFRNVKGARLRWLTLEEVTRLLNACEPELRKLVQAGLLTGCREGDLLAMQVRDFDPESETALVPDGKTGKRRVPLTEEGVLLFESITAGRKPHEPIFFRADGSPWYRVAVIRAMQDVCASARIEPPATFYTLRHTYASHLVQQGTPLIYVASVLGHTDTRMVEEHYGHFAPSHVAETIRAKLPSFGIKVDQKVRRVGRKS